MYRKTLAHQHRLVGRTLKPTVEKSAAAAPKPSSPL